MNKFLALVVVALAATLQVGAATEHHTFHDLAAQMICENDSVKLYWIDQVAEVMRTASKLEAGKPYMNPSMKKKKVCNDPALQTMKDFEPLVTDLSNVCSQEKANQLVNYYKANGAIMPTILKRVFFRLGLKISHKCEAKFIEVVNNLDASAVQSYVASLPEVDYHQLVDKLALSVVANNGKQLSAPINADAAKKIDEAREACNKLRSAYGPWLESQLTLATIGMNANVGEHKDEHKHSPMLKVVNLCEALVHLKTDGSSLVYQDQVASSGSSSANLNVDLEDNLFPDAELPASILKQKVLSKPNAGEEDFNNKLSLVKTAFNL